EGIGTSLGLAVPSSPWDSGEETSSGYIFISHKANADRATLVTTVVHEFFHILQYAHRTSAWLVPQWYYEATAIWAEAYYAHHYAAKVHRDWYWHLQRSDISLHAEKPSLHPYGAYLWPL